MVDAVSFHADSNGRPSGRPPGRFERRMAATTLVLGTALAAVTLAMHSAPAATGVMLGTLLAWLNLRWLDQAARALAGLAQAETAAEKPQIPQSTWVKFFARYALMALALYVTVTRSPVPLVSVVGGLLMLGAAAMVVGLYETFTSR